MGESIRTPVRLQFDRRVHLEFHVRKLLVILNAMLKHKTPWQVNHASTS